MCLSLTSIFDVKAHIDAHKIVETRKAPLGTFSRLVSFGNDGGFLLARNMCLLAALTLLRTRHYIYVFEDYHNIKYYERF